MKTKAVLLLLLLLVVLSSQAQLKVTTNGKVGIAGAGTTYGFLQINKDGATNGLSLTQSNNYETYPFRIFRKGLTGYIARNDTAASCIRMLYNGRVAMGGISDYAGGAQLSVYGNNYVAFASRLYYPSNNGGDGLKSCVEQPNNNTFAGWYTPTSGTNQLTFYVKGTGDVGYMGALVFLSDTTIKSNVKSIESPLSIIQKLNGVTYKNEFREKIKNDYFKSRTKKDEDFISKDSTFDKEYADKLMAEYDKRDMGLIAQEVEKVLPDIVYSMGPDKKGIAYTQLIALLIEGIKEQQQEIETLNETVADMQGISKASSSNIVTSLNNAANSDSSVLYQNAPNPFTTQTQIAYYLSATAADAQLCVYNLNGQQLRCIKLTDRGSGTVTFQANDLQAGIYLYSLIVDGKEAACKRMVLTD